MNKSATKQEKAQGLHEQLEHFVQGLLVELDQRLDQRLVRIFLLTWQNRHLLLSGRDPRPAIHRPAARRVVSRTWLLHHFSRIAPASGTETPRYRFIVCARP